MDGVGDNRTHGYSSTICEHELYGLQALTFTQLFQILDVCDDGVNVVTDLCILGVILYYTFTHSLVLNVLSYQILICSHYYRCNACAALAYSIAY